MTDTVTNHGDLPDVPETSGWGGGTATQSTTSPRR